MMQVGDKNLITDVAGLCVGNAHDLALKSGVTVLTSDAPMMASYHVMGGAPGTRDTELLDPDKTVQTVDAFVLSGGSAFGLDAASGVVKRLRETGRGFRVGAHHVPIVPTAILFDLMNAGDKNWTDNPYPKLGEAAYDACGTTFELGTQGAGFGALCGIMKGGLGSASFRLDADAHVGALIAANPIGNVTDHTGRHFWAAPFEVDGEYGGVGSPNSAGQGQSLDQTKLGRLIERANTTIGIVATELTLSKAELKRLAVVAHDGLARAIVPSHLPMDGDLIFAVSTQKIKHNPTSIEFAELCHSAALCVSRATARGIYNASSQPGDTLPTWSELNS